MACSDQFLPQTKIFLTGQPRAEELRDNKEQKPQGGFSQTTISIVYTNTKYI